MWDIGQQIWDALKLTAGIAAGDLTVDYLIAAACPTAFTTSDGRELYGTGSGEHTVAELLRVNARAWQHDLDELVRECPQKHRCGHQLGGGAELQFVAGRDDRGPVG